MGKKSKRNRGASKKQNGTTRVESRVSETSSAASDIAVVGGIEPPRGATTSISSTSTNTNRDITQSLSNLIEIKDYEGIIKLESDAIRQAKALEGKEPKKASYIYVVIARAIYNKTGSSNKEAREKAIRYLERCWTAIHSLERSFALLEKGIMHDCVKYLASLYLKEGRHDEAFATVKRLTDSIPQHEHIDPDLILFLADEFSDAYLNELKIDILTMFLGTINRSWDKEKRAAAYLAFGEGYTCLTEYEKAASFLHKALAITDDTENKVAVLSQMGFMLTCSCNYDDAFAALNQALEILSAEAGGKWKKSTKSWSEMTAFIHIEIGEVLSEQQGKRDLEALESFERALVIIKEEDLGDGDATRNLVARTCHESGVVHARLGNWDEAIDYLKLAYRSIGTDTDPLKSHFHAAVCENIGRVRLDQYFWDARLRQDTQKRENIILEALIFSKESMTFGLYINDAFLNCAQAAYLIADIAEATRLLTVYFEAEMEKKNGIYCRSCDRIAGKGGTDIKTCRNCQVVDYCSEAHQTLAWRRGRLSHKVMCPFLKRYRLVVKAENRIDTEPIEDICKDFFETVCVLKYEE
jgi:tetratricopeptide (TPR) repeat protein